MATRRQQDGHTGAQSRIASKASRIWGMSETTVSHTNA